MILYFRILTSIFLSLLAISIFTSFVVAIYSFNSDTFGFSKALGMSSMIASFGFVLFGFTGALYWSTLFKLSNRFFSTLFRAHTFSSILSMPMTIATFHLFLRADMGSDGAFEMTIIFFIFILPVVLLSLYFYKITYLNSGDVYLDKD